MLESAFAAKKEKCVESLSSADGVSREVETTLRCASRFQHRLSELLVTALGCSKI